MDEIIGKIFRSLRPAFTRDATFTLFVVASAGIMLRYDDYGVSSIVRALALAPSAYPCLLHLFHSTAWDKDRLLLAWMGFLLREGVALEVNGRAVVLGDHTKQPKDGRKMPETCTMRQDSETSSKPSYFRGHHWGFIAMVSGMPSWPTAIPLWGEIHRDSGDETRSVRLINKAIGLAMSAGKRLYMVLDAFFSVGPVMAAARDSGGLVHVLARAKKNVTAYKTPKKPRKGKRGRPCVYGAKIRLGSLFERKSSVFQHAEMKVYRKAETVRFMTLDLVWKPVKGLIRFFLVETSRGQIILMSTDLELRVEDAVRLYCARSMIENAFDVFKNMIGGMSYRFWSKYLQPVSRRPSKNTEPRRSSKPLKTAMTLAAIENFVAASVVAHGVLQYLSLAMPEEIMKSNRCWMRTPPKGLPSEFVTKHAVSNCIKDLLKSSAKNWIACLIRARQDRRFDLNSEADIFEDVSGF